MDHSEKDRIVPLLVECKIVVDFLRSRLKYEGIDGTPSRVGLNSHEDHRLRKLVENIDRELKGLE